MPDPDDAMANALADVAEPRRVTGSTVHFGNLGSSKKGKIV